MEAEHFPFERAAAQGWTMPGGLKLYDMQAFQALRYLYRAYEIGAVAREQAAQEKQAIYRAWVKARDTATFWDEVNTKHVELMKAGEAARAAYRKERTLENADVMLKVEEGIYGR